MIDANYNIDTRAGDFLLRPNCSLPWRSSYRLLWAVTGFVGLVMLGFAAAGFWLVVPFAGAELAGLWIAMYLTALSQQRKERLVFSPTELRWEIGRYRPEVSWTLPRAWARLSVRGLRGHGPPRLFLRCHGRSIEIGRRLGAEDRQWLARNLPLTHAEPARTPSLGKPQRTL